MEVLPLEAPTVFRRVSPKHIRRAVVRYTMLLLTAIAALSLAWSRAYLLFAVTPLLVVVAWLQWRHHGFALTDHLLTVRRGLVRHREWILPTDKYQVFYASQTIFQRRLKLKTVYVDTAGASSLAYPAIRDLPENEADQLVQTLYDSFRRAAPSPSAAPVVSRS